MGPEMSILVWLQNNLRSGLGDALFSSIAQSMTYYILALVVGFALVLYRPTRIIGAAVLLGVGISVLFSDVILGMIINRPRPAAVYPYIEPLFSVGKASFPSGPV